MTRWWWALVLAACTPGAERPTMDEARRRMSEMLLESPPCAPEAENASVSLYDPSCASGICMFGECQPLLGLDMPWQVPTVIAKLKTLAESSPEPEVLRAEAVAILADQVDHGKALAFRARAVQAIEELGASDELRKRFVAMPLPIQEQASVSLARLGDATGLDLVIALTEHEDMPVALEAIRALGTFAAKGGKGEVLPTLLACLSSDIPIEVQRSALQALAEAKDRRALGPLVSYLEAGPEPLADLTSAALSAIEGTRIGPDVAAWQRWVAAHAAPAAPAYTLRKPPSSTEDIDLPEP